MKNTVISIISIILIAVYSVFSFLFTEKISVEFEDKIRYAETYGYTEYTAESLQQTLDSNLTLLNITTSKEYTDTIEECIVNIKYSIKYNDMMNMNIYKNLLLNTIDEIRKLNIMPV